MCYESYPTLFVLRYASYSTITITTRCTRAWFLLLTVLFYDSCSTLLITLLLLLVRLLLDAHLPLFLLLLRHTHIFNYTLLILLLLLPLDAHLLSSYL